MTLRDLLVISGLCLLTEDADEAFRLTLKKEIIHLYGEDVFERLEAIEASNEESEEVMLQILRSLAVDQEFLDVKAGIPARDAEIAALRKEIETLKATMGAEPVALPSDDDLSMLFGMWGWRTKEGRNLRFSHFKEMVGILLGKYAHIAAPVETHAPAFSVGVHGVGVIDDNPSALAVYFNAAPNDDDIRALHEIVTNAPVAAQVQPDPRTPADTLVNGGALILALNALRRAGKNEIADELEKTVSLLQQPVSGADGWSLAKKVRRDLDRQSCPDAYMRIAVESIVKHYEPPQSPGNPGQPDHLPDATKMVEPSGNSEELPSDDWLTGCVGVQNQGGLHQITGLADIRRFAECVLKHWGKQDAGKVDALERAVAGLKRYTYGYKDDGFGGPRYLGTIESPDGRLLIRDDVLSAIDAARKEQA